MAAMDMVSHGGSSVDARIHGDISGQVAVGNNILQNNVSHGGVVYVAAPGQKPTVRRRSFPIQLAGRAEPPLLGREFELGEVASGLQVAGVVQVCGSPGAGKTSLLKSVVHRPPPDTAADGVVYHAAIGEPVDDVLQSLFEAFYTSDVPFKPTDVEIRHALQPIRALVALDDVTQASDRMQRVLDAAPSAAFVLASPRPVLAGVGPSLSLQGLGEEAALALLERGLGRALTARERSAAQAIVEALEGQPLSIVQVAGVVTQLNQSLPRLARQMRAGDGVETLTEKIFSSLSDNQRDVLALLAAMDQAPLYVDNVADLTGIADVGPVVESLLLLGLVQAHSPRFSLTADLGTDRRRDLDSDRWGDRVLESLPDWVERQKEPESVIREAPAILQALQDGVARRAWAKVLRLGQTVESALILGRRWGAWEAVLRHQLQAARGLGDKAAEGWSLHQLGTRALCLGDTFTARAQLLEALRIRESLGDTDGAAVTRHNLELLSGPPPPPRRPDEPPPKPPAGWRPPLLAGAAVIAVLVLGLTAAVLRSTTDSTRPITSVVDLMGGELSAHELDFGDQEVGTTSDVLGARLANTGDQPVVIDTVTLAGASPSDFLVSEDPCTGTSVAPGNACTVGIRFRPSAIGVRHATLVISRGGGTVPVVLRGNGTAPAVAADTTVRDSDPGPERDPTGTATFVLAAEPSSLTIRNQPLGTTSAPSTVTVRNQGTALAVLSRVSLLGAHAGDFAVGSDECGGRTLLAGGSCRIAVTFRPTDVGTRSATLEVGPDGEAPLLVPLQGTAAPSADLSVKIEPASVDGGVGFEVAVTNNGPSPVPAAVLTVRSSSFNDELVLVEEDGMTCVDGDTPQYDCTVSELRPNDSATATFVIRCGTFDVRVRSDVPDPNGDNDDTTGSVPCVTADTGTLPR